MKVIGPALSLGASGSLKKTLTYQRKMGGHALYLHNKPGGRQPFTPSPEQLAIRTHVQEAVAAWHALSTSEQQAWQDFIKNYLS